MKPQVNKNNRNTLIIAIAKTAFLTILLTAIASCSKSDDAAPAVENTKLALPAVLENTTGAVVSAGTRISATGPNCGADIVPGTAESTITITKDGIIADENKVTIELEISDAVAGEVVVQLINPAGETTSLIKRIGATSNTSCGSDLSFSGGRTLSFNQAFTGTVILPGISGDVISSGNYAPLRSTNNYPTTIPDNTLTSILKDKNIKGDWKLKLSDYGQANLLALIKWRIKFATGALR